MLIYVLAGSVAIAAPIAQDNNSIETPELKSETAAQAERFNFRVPACSLDKVVEQIAEQAKASISFDLRDAGDIRVKGVRGRMTLQEALARALDGSGWAIEATGHNAWRLTPTDSDDAILVVGRRQDFVRTRSSLSTRTDTPLRQTPGTIDSVTEEVLKSQNALSVAEALRNIPGVIFSVGGNSQATIGGDSTGGVTMTGGLRNSTYLDNPPVTDVEAIEVLKGPAAILTGTFVGGGTINFVPKRARGNRLLEINGGLGTADERFLGADLGGTLSSDLQLFGRLNLLWQEADELPNGGRNPYQRVVNPMLGLKTPGGLTIDASLQVLEKHTPFVDRAFYDPTTERFTRYGDRVNPDAGIHIRSTRLYWGFESDLVSNSDTVIKLRGRSQFQWTEQESQIQSPIIAEMPGGMGTYLFNASSAAKDRNFAGYLDVYAKFRTGEIEHQMIVAFDSVLRHYEKSNVMPGVGFSTGNTVDLQPVPRDAPRGIGAERQYGIIVQDQLNYGRWHAMIGLRQSTSTN